MARTCTEEKQEETRLISHPEDDDDDDDDEEDEEALSLCDLPVSRENIKLFPRKEESSRNENSQEASTKPEESFDFGFNFDFGSSTLVGSDSAELAEMSTADELFFKGWILPLRHSISSDTSFPELTRLTCDPTRRLSRSESVDFRQTGSFASGGSSRYNSCGSSTTTTTITTGGGGSELRIKNQFMNYSLPSPQPQIRRVSSLKARVSNSRSPKFSIWDFLRLGLVRAPDIELQDIKARHVNNHNNNRVSVSRNSSCSSTSTSHSSNKSNSSKFNKTPNPKINEHDSKQRKPQHGFVVSDRKRGFLFGDCRCSVNASETIPLNNYASVITMEDKLRELQIRKKKKTTRTTKTKEREKKEQKQALSRHKTFEWLKELSHASFVDHGSLA